MKLGKKISLLPRRRDRGNSDASGLLSGTRVRTEHGERAIETLQPGDRIITRTGKLVRIAEVNMQSRSDQKSGCRLISIAQGAFGGGIPRRDLYLSPDQRVSMSPAMLNRSMGHDTAQIAAGDLVWMAGVTELNATPPITYVKIVCDTPQVIYANGLTCCASGNMSADDPEPVLNATDIALLAIDRAIEAEVA